MPEKVQEGLVCPEMGRFVGARGFSCPKRVFRARKGAEGVSLSGNGTFRGVKGFFVPKKGVSCQKRCRQGAFVRKWDVSWGQGVFRAQKGHFVPEKVRAGRIRPEMGHFVGARCFSCPQRAFRARKGVGREHTSRNGMFHGRKGFVPKKGVSCKNRCGREYSSAHGTFRGRKRLFGGRVGHFVNKWEGRWTSRQQISQERGRRGLQGHFGGRRQRCGLSSLDGACFPVGLVKNGQCGFFSPNRRSTHLIFPFFPFFTGLALPCPFVSSSLSVSSSARCFFLFGLFCLLSSALEGSRLRVRDERGGEVALVAVFETLGRRGIVLAGGK